MFNFTFKKARFGNSMPSIFTQKSN